MKTKLTKLIEDYDVEFDEALQIAQDKLPREEITGKGKGTWINEEGVKILDEAFDIPEIVPKHIKVKIISECPNRCYNWGHSKELGKKVPVLIPRRFYGALVGKTISVECITDDTGTSYRYVHQKRK
tara:strand:- start:141 stop:521 length:381 start_codon:yes stop_codon:yes gene_type:complete